MPSLSLRAAFALAMALGAIGAAWPAVGGLDALGLCAWLAIFAAPAGALSAGVQVQRGERLQAGLVLVAPATWSLLLVLAPAPRGLSEIHWAACAVTGFYAGGFGLARLLPWPALRSAGVLLLVGAIGTGIAGTAGVLGTEVWSPPVAARLLDLSPPGFVLECAGLDWMRHPAVYETVGTSAIGPELRSAFRGSLAGPTSLVLGCALAGAGLFAGAVPPRTNT